MKPRWILLTACLLLATLPACTNKQAAAGPALSPNEPGSAVSTPDDEDERYANRRVQGAKEEVIREQDEAMQTLGEVTWDDQPDAGPAKAISQEEEEKARIAKQNKEAKDLADTENAVSRALQGVMPQIRACYSADATGSFTLDIRVHRMGYVLGSSLAGSSAEIGNCVQRVLSTLRISGVKTDTINVKRTFRFKGR